MDKKKQLDPTDREIIRVLRPLKLPVTPAKIADTIHVHPQTVKDRLKELDKEGITKCDFGEKHKQTKCKINPKWKG